MAKMTNIVNKVWEALGMGQKQGEEIDEEELDSQAQVEDVYALDNEPEDEEEAKGLFGRRACFLRPDVLQLRKIAAQNPRRKKRLSVAQMRI